MSSADFKLDALLRDVMPPSGLLERLMALPYADDAGLDEVVRDVELPDGLLQRLRAIPLGDDDGLDAALRNVPVPDDLATSFHRHARWLARHRDRPIDRTLRFSRIAMAASLIFAVTLSLGSALLLSWILNRAGQSGPGTGIEVAHDVPPPKEEPLETSWRTLADDDAGADGLDRSAYQPSQGGDVNTRREISVAKLESAADRARLEALADGNLPAGADPLALFLPGSPIVSPDNGWDNMPELPTRPTSPVPRGLDWPLVKGANRPLLIEKGFHPFVSPAANSALQSCAVPLAVEPSSYELTRRYLEQNELPPANRVRTEEFLAAVDYNFPKPTSRGLGLTVAGGPSPICGEGFSLLQIGVQAWQGDDMRHAPMHLVLLIDTSTSMRWGSRMEIVRRALAGLPELVGPDDRLSLVTFNQAAHVLVEDLGHREMPQFRAASDSLAAEGSTNFVGGLREACSLARESLGPGRPAVRMLLLTDGLLDLDPATAEKVEKQVADAAGQKVPLDVIDLGQQKDTDPQLAGIAKAGQGSVHRAASAEQVRWAFREIITGRSQVVARSARLRVTFNPKAVIEYRIIGHESGDWAGMLPGPLESDFREGQAATGLFEMRLAPNGPEDLATVEVSWYAPDSDPTLAGKTVRKAVVAVQRKQFAGTLTSSSPWLQQAAVVAYTAEVLRHSPFIFLRHPGLSMAAAWHRAHELSMEVDGRLAQNPSFAEFIGLISQEMKTRPPRHTARD